MNILYYTSGLSGIGRLVFGISIFNALKRKDIEFKFTLLSCAPAERTVILDNLNIPHIEIEMEDPSALRPSTYETSSLYQTITSINPDILIVDRVWFSLHHLIDKLPCKKIFISSQVMDEFFSMELPEETISFDPSPFNRVIAIEPFKSSIQFERINPLVIRNRNEIFPRNRALEKLGLSGEKKICFIGLNFKEGYFENLKKKYSHIEKQNFDVIYSTNIRGEGIFPIADYYNAIDLVITSPTYNSFWETKYFGKERVFEFVPAVFCDLHQRIRECGDYEFSKNGADQMAEILCNL